MRLPKKKQCSRCKKILPSTSFTKHKKRLRSYCKVCQRRENLFYQHHITPEEWDVMFEKQEKRCAICRKDITSKVGWTLDHDHATNKNRAILCDNCNKMLGHSKEDVQTLTNAIYYLKSEGLSIIN